MVKEVRCECGLRPGWDCVEEDIPWRGRTPCRLGPVPVSNREGRIVFRVDVGITHNRHNVDHVWIREG
jgi:hypothetical protein